MGLPKPQPKAEAATTSCENRKSRWNLSTYHIRLSCFECRFQTGIRSLRNCAWFILRARICLCHSRAILSSELQLLDLSRENGCVSIWRRSGKSYIANVQPRTIEAVLPIYAMNVIRIEAYPKHADFKLLRLQMRIPSWMEEHQSRKPLLGLSALAAEYGPVNENTYPPSSFYRGVVAAHASRSTVQGQKWQKVDNTATLDLGLGDRPALRSDSRTPVVGLMFVCTYSTSTPAGLNRQVMQGVGPRPSPSNRTTISNIPEQGMMRGGEHFWEA